MALHFVCNKTASMHTGERFALVFCGCGTR